MKLFLQIFIFLLTWFTSSATFSATKIVVLTNTKVYLKTDIVNQSEKAKIGVHQKSLSLSNFLKEENSCVLDFQKTTIQKQFAVAQFSKNLLI
ncbi:hypothetical protein Fluta_0333 [Fluviicola taffensis DSM 16823]|uniref:Uncharacterized protein n=1 Tax=Fluviicola taffensis (strain DSM 16823 / NCIMB 13979 / RW262) TaxID=755732 RepID=F2IDG6_FLUTR|nr:hypothetical protein Fluta_0333 [Fluviicola taffensis DSM 16823]